MKLTAPAPHGSGCSGDDCSIFTDKNRELLLVANTGSVDRGLRHPILQEGEIHRVRLILELDAVRVVHGCSGLDAA